MREFRWAIQVITLVLTASLLGAQARPTGDPKSFRTEIEVTSISATVTDAGGHPVVGLSRDAFEVYDDGEKQTITQFANQRVPLSVGVLIDTSDSMFGQRIADARSAVTTFLFEQLADTDEFFILAFNHTPRLLTQWTRAHNEVTEALAGIRPSGGTAVYDAVMAALPIIDARANRRASLLVISDGADTASSTTVRELNSALHRTDAFVYAIAIDSPGHQAINTGVSIPTLAAITGETGGRTEVIHASAELSAAAARIAQELNSQYVLGYPSPRGHDGRFHSVRVRVAPPGYRVRARKGYVAG